MSQNSKDTKNTFPRPGKERNSDAHVAECGLLTLDREALLSNLLYLPRESAGRGDGEAGHAGHRAVGNLIEELIRTERHENLACR